MRHIKLAALEDEVTILPNSTFYFHLWLCISRKYFVFVQLELREQMPGTNSTMCMNFIW